MGLVKLDSLEFSGLGTIGREIAAYSIGGRDYFMAFDYTLLESEVHIWEVLDSGALAATNTEDRLGDTLGPVDLSVLFAGKFTTLETSTGVYAYSFGYFENFFNEASQFGAPLNVFSIDADGELTRVGFEGTATVLSAYDEILTIGNRDFLIHLQAQPFSLLVGLHIYNVSDATALEKLYSTLPIGTQVATNFQSPSPIEAFEFQNNGYVMMQNGSALSVFRLGAQGALKSQTDWADNINNAYTSYLTTPRAPVDADTVVINISGDTLRMNAANGTLTKMIFH